MAKHAIVATFKTAPGKRDEYLKHLKAHGRRCLATEPGTLKFEILVPKKEADTLLLYEVYEPGGLPGTLGWSIIAAAEQGCGGHGRQLDRRWMQSR